MPKTIKDKIILDIYIDVCKGLDKIPIEYQDIVYEIIPRELKDWHLKFNPKKNRKAVTEDVRCKALTHEEIRCIKRIHKKTSKEYCHQHSKKLQKEGCLAFGSI